MIKYIKNALQFRNISHVLTKRSKLGPTIDYLNRIPLNYHESLSSLTKRNFSTNKGKNSNLKNISIIHIQSF